MNSQPTHVLYPGKHFEIREHDAPTKYVFNGATRVAHVTGSLSTDLRVQHLRVQPGWNLCSLAVTATNALSQLNSLAAFGGEGQDELVSAAYKWSSAFSNWLSVITSETLPAGTVLWLYATTNATLSITGPYTDPTNRPVTAAGHFFPSAGLEIWNLKSAISNLPSSSAWTYDSITRTWRSTLPPPLAQSDLPPFLAPGAAAFVRADAPAQLEISETALRLLFYHPNHLGSAEVFTDALGSVEQENSSYPFGGQRTMHSHGTTSTPYGFSQKETDSESALAYFEARFLHSASGRFISVEPLGKLGRNHPPPEGQRRKLASPQRHGNSYSYAANNPLRFIDPTGFEASTVPVPGENVSVDASGQSHILLDAGNQSYPRFEIVIQNDQTARITAPASTRYRQDRPNPRAQFDREGHVLSFTQPKITVSIRTTYQPGVSPGAPSAYGRGTTPEDIASGNTTLRFHESRHGRAFIDYLREHRLPEFGGQVGMTRDEWNLAVAEYRERVDTYFLDMRRELEPLINRTVDCVGIPGPPPICRPVSTVLP